MEITAVGTFEDGEWQRLGRLAAWAGLRLIRPGARSEEVFPFSADTPSEECPPQVPLFLVSASAAAEHRALLARQDSGPSEAETGAPGCWVVLQWGQESPQQPSETTHCFCVLRQDAPDERLQVDFARARQRAELLYQRHVLVRQLAANEAHRGLYRRLEEIVLSDLEPRAAMRQVVDLANNLLESEASSVFFVDTESRELTFGIVSGPIAHTLEGVKLSPGQGIVGWVAMQGVPLLVPDVRKDPRFFPQIDRFARYRTRSVLCVPILSGDRTVGVFEAVNCRAGAAAFGESHLAAARAVSDRLAIIMDNDASRSRAEALAARDPLTDLYNARHILRSLDAEISRSGRSGTALSVIFADLDNFKSVNDKHGHLIGRGMLREVGHVLKEALTEIDYPGRYGGDEFVAVLPHTGVREALERAERVRKHIAGAHFLRAQDLDLRITASIGVATYPDHAQTVDALLAAADRAMQRAKKLSRNRVVAAEEAEST
ncbi:MAG: sensor domain-containing diguanylate cyclase [Candidatus Schekmanbacteria bacterium]|nr:sensor domain-containing diguanylate cyclase [Candidatus Schekmanbacteria bacterium]